MIDPLSKTWEAIVKRCEADIVTSQQILERPNTTERIADFERGKIAQARDILKLVETKPTFASTSYT